MKMAGRWDALVLFGLLAVCAAAAMADDLELDPLLQQQQPLCAQAEGIIKKAVEEEFSKNNQITAGFLRVFFHDCFSGGCDASIFLTGEWDRGVNRGSVQDRVRTLVNEIRAKVHAACGGPTVSCADILAIATRDSVVAAKGPFIPIVPGRLDSKAPGDISRLPGPFDPIDSLLALFRDFGLRDPADLVALSGGHTVGKTKICGIVRPGFQASCGRNGNQNLDVITPVVFDNQYYVALNRSQGVFDSDQGLLSHKDTKDLVLTFAKEQRRFFNQFIVSFRKLSMVRWANKNTGEIRNDCTKPNGGRINSIIDATEGFADTLA